MAARIYRKLANTYLGLGKRSIKPSSQSIQCLSSSTSPTILTSEDVSRTSMSYNGYINRLSNMYENITIGQMQPSDSDISCKSHRLMLYNGIIEQSHPGCYFLLPIGLKSMEKLIKVIDEEMRCIGAQKISMPSLVSGHLFKQTGRWDSTGPELIKLKDRHGIDYCLGPTHEEPITSLMASHVRLSYRKLPVKLYQITSKFRDEMSPKYGLLRGREFMMKDLYTFDNSIDAAVETYHQVCEAYCKFFERLGVDYTKVAGDTGKIGGTLSHEFHLPADVGEDILYICDKCGYKTNKELLEEGNSGPHSECHHQFTETKGIEICHAFLLGTKYSSIFKADFLDENKKCHMIEMGCYGIGVSRALAGFIEVLSLDNRIRWPKLLAPYQICILPQKDGHRSEDTKTISEDLYHSLDSLANLHNEVVLDDRTHMTIGKRLYEGNRLGYPVIIVVGKKALEKTPIFELVDVYDGTTTYWEKNELIQKLSQVETVR